MGSTIVAMQPKKKNPKCVHLYFSFKLDIQSNQLLLLGTFFK